MSSAIKPTMTSIVDEEESVLAFLSIFFLAVLKDLAVSTHDFTLDLHSVWIDQRNDVFLKEFEASEPLSHDFDVIHSLLEVPVWFTC